LAKARVRPFPAWIRGRGQCAPVNPERFPGAIETQYLNFNNLASFRDIFRQGVVEQRMFIDALEKVTIDPSVVASCTGLSLPNGETTYHFSMTPLLAQGQSMGGDVYEPRQRGRAADQGVGPDRRRRILGLHGAHDEGRRRRCGQLKIVLGTGDLTFLHPTLSLLETAWRWPSRTSSCRGSPIVPFWDIRRGRSTNPSGGTIATSRSGSTMAPPRLRSHPSRQRRMAIDARCAHPRWSRGDQAASDFAEHESEGGETYTAAVLQYNGDGIADPHSKSTANSTR